MCILYSSPFYNIKILGWWTIKSGTTKLGLHYNKQDRNVGSLDSGNITIIKQIIYSKFSQIRKGTWWKQTRVCPNSILYYICGRKELFFIFARQKLVKIQISSPKNSILGSIKSKKWIYRGQPITFTAKVLQIKLYTQFWFILGQK